MGHDDGIAPPPQNAEQEVADGVFEVKAAFGWAVHGKYRAKTMTVPENVEQFVEWLKGQPDICAVFVTRTGLRVMPLVVSELDGQKKAGANIVMPVFRALATAWTVSARTVSAWPARTTDAQDTAYAAGKAAFAAGVAEAGAKNPDAEVVASTAGYAADVAANTADHPDAGAPVTRITEATGLTTFRTALQDDIARFEGIRQAISSPAFLLGVVGDGGARQVAASLA